MSEEEYRESLKKRFLDYAKKLRKKKPEWAQKIEEKVDDLVAWYLKNQRDMTPEEFEKVLGL